MMDDAAPHSKWVYWLVLVILSVVVIFFQLVPFQILPGGWAMPDLLICLCYAWVLRRSDYAPIILIGAIMLVADMLFMRPPGLMAALFVLGAEFLRARVNLLRELPFALEWAMVAGVLLAILLANRFALVLVMQPRPAVWLSLSQLLTTLAAYPFVVLFSRYALGIRKMSAGEVDALGHRL
jgi:rod shape-determining protein MreD